MNTTRDLDQLLRDHFGGRADRAVLDGQLDAILLQTANLRQRPGWLAALRSPSMTTQAIAGRVAVPNVVWLAALVALTLAVLLATVFIVGGRPAGPPLNGRLLISRFESGSSIGGSRSSLTPLTLMVATRLSFGRNLHDMAHRSLDGKTILFSESFLNPDMTTTSTGLGRERRRQWLPDPRRSAFVRSAQSLACSAWSPDGTRVLCEGWDYPDPSRNGLYTISSTDGSDLVRVTTPPPDSHEVQGSSSSTQTSGRDIPGTYSPDGTMIAFAGAVAPFTDGTTGIERQDGLMVVNTDGTGRRRVGTLVTGDRAEWSPDGRLILVSSGGRLYSVEVSHWSCDASHDHGSADRPCMKRARSPDGTRIPFGRSGEGRSLYDAPRWH